MNNLGATGNAIPTRQNGCKVSEKRCKLGGLVSGSSFQFGELFHSHQEPPLNSWPRPVANLIGKTEPSFAHGPVAVADGGYNYATHRST